MKLDLSIPDVVDFEWWKAVSYRFANCRPYNDPVDSNPNKDGLAFIVPEEGQEWPQDFKQITVDDLYDPDEGNPVHIDLMNSGLHDDLDTWIEFVTQWGLLGSGYKWRQLEYEPKKSKTRALSDSTVVISSPSPSNDIPRELSGATYFGWILNDNPNSIELPHNWHGATSGLDLRNFQGWPYYGEWFLSPHLGADYLEDQFYYYLFSCLNYARQQFINPINIHHQNDQFSSFIYEGNFLDYFHASKPYKREPFSQTQLGLELSLEDFPKRLIRHVDMVLDLNPEQPINVKFRPRTLLDYCLLVIGLENIMRCRNCLKALQSSQKYCGKKCENSFHNRKQNQAKNFQEFLRERGETTMTKTFQNNKGNPIHPSQLIEDSPLFSGEKKPLDPAEKKRAREWAEYYKTEKSRSGPRREDRDLLLEVVIS